MNIIRELKKIVFLGIVTVGIISILYMKTAHALEEPRALATDSRIKVVTYQKNNVIPLNGQTFITTQIIFGENEKIVDVQGGDASAWTVNVNNTLTNVLNVKPTIVDSHTDLSVTTLDDNDKRRYYRFELKSSKNLPETYAIQFVYPDEEKAKVISQLDYLQLEKKNILKAYKNPEAYNWDYSFSGSRSILPLHVFDDGRFTYMELLPNQPSFAVFAVDNYAGEEAVVNYRRVGDYLVIQEIAPQFTLRAGKHSIASVFNNRVIDAGKRGAL